jgi:hypothetical protein
MDKPIGGDIYVVDFGGTLIGVPHSTLIDESGKKMPWPH